MGLSLKELVELAMMDCIMDQPVTLERLMGAGAPWHELSGRRDVGTVMAESLHNFLEGQLVTVIEIAEGELGTPLVSGEAAMALQRAAEHPEMLAQVQVAVTEDGKAYYKKLAHRYYNG